MIRTKGMNGGQILQKLVEEKAITPQGLSWLTLAVDPWHDTAVTGFEGLPDQGIGKSVTFQVVQELSISKNTSPVPLPAGNWSVRIGNYPILQDLDVSSGLYYGDIITQNNSTTELMVPIQVNYAADGVDMDSVAIGGLTNPQGISLPTEFCKGIVKVCGIGIEVINTTAELQRQGLMSCCRMVQPDMEPYCAYISQSVPANSWATKTVTPVRSLPKNLQEMALYPGFAQDEAKNGYYAPVLLKFGKERHYPLPISALLLEDDTAAGLVNVATPIVCHTSRNTPFTAPGNTTQFYTTRTQPLFYGADSNVIFFSGLSDATTLTLRVRFILERFPSDSESQILVIATPSAPYDPAVLEIYSKAVQMLPAGVPFTENPAGEWWKKMLSSIGSVASPMLKMLPHPLAQGLARAVDVGVRALEDSEGAKRDIEAARSVRPKRPQRAIAPPPKQVGTQTGRIPAQSTPGRKKRKKALTKA